MKISETTDVVQAIRTYILNKTGTGDCRIFLWDTDLGAYVCHWPQADSFPFESPSYANRQEIDAAPPMNTAVQRIEPDRLEEYRVLCYLLPPAKPFAVTDEVTEFLDGKIHELRLARLVGAEQREKKYTAVLRRISAILTSDSPIHRRLANLVEHLQSGEGFTSEAAITFLPRAGSSTLYYFVAGQPRHLETILADLSIDSSSLSTFASSFPADRICINLKKAPDSLRLLGPDHDPLLTAALPSKRYRNYLTVQIKTPYRVYGYILLVNKSPSGPGHRSWFTDQDAELLTSVAISLGSVVDSSFRVESMIRGGDQALQLMLTLASRVGAFQHPEDFAQGLVSASLAVTNAKESLVRLPKAKSKETLHNGLLESVRNLATAEARLQNLLAKLGGWRDRGADSQGLGRLELNKLVQDFRDYADQQLPFQNVTIRLRLSPNLPATMTVDRSALQVVLLGLLNILSRIVSGTGATIVFATSLSEDQASLRLEAVIEGGPESRFFLEGVDDEDLLTPDIGLNVIWRTLKGIADTAGLRIHQSGRTNAPGFVVSLPLTPSGS